MPLWLTEADVTGSIDLAGAIGALERVLAAEADGKAANMVKTHLMVGANDVLQAIGGSVAPQGEWGGLCGTKTWVNVAGKSQTVLILFSLVDGSLKAIVEATACVTGAAAGARRSKNDPWPKRGDVEAAGTESS